LSAGIRKSCTLPAVGRRHCEGQAAGKTCGVSVDSSALLKTRDLNLLRLRARREAFSTVSSLAGPPPSGRAYARSPALAVAVRRRGAQGVLRSARRYCTASATCAACTAPLPARSAIVRDTRKARWVLRAL